MKKVQRVSIGRIAFSLEDDAYELLNDYLNDLQAHYADKCDGKEIIEGIEERISELFIEKCGTDRVVPIETVREIINIIGTPADMEGDDEKADEQDRANYQASPKRLYRDPKNKVISGVCGGLGAYFNIDPVIFRIIFLALFFGATIFGGIGGGTAVILYIGLIIAIPEAKTVEQRCAMRGETPQLSDIQKKVEKEVKEMGKSIRKFGKENKNTGQAVLRGFLIVVGSILTVIALIGLVSVVANYNHIYGFHSLFDNWNALTTGVVPAFLVKDATIICLCLALIAILYGGIQMIAGFKEPSWKPGLILFLLWLLSLIILIGLSISAFEGGNIHSFIDIF